MILRAISRLRKAICLFRSCERHREEDVEYEMHDYFRPYASEIQDRKNHPVVAEVSVERPYEEIGEAFAYEKPVESPAYEKLVEPPEMYDARMPAELASNSMPQLFGCNSWLQAEELMPRINNDLLSSPPTASLGQPGGADDVEMPFEMPNDTFASGTFGYPTAPQNNPGPVDIVDLLSFSNLAGQAQDSSTMVFEMSGQPEVEIYAPSTRSFGSDQSVHSRTDLWPPRHHQLQGVSIMSPCPVDEDNTGNNFFLPPETLSQTSCSGSHTVGGNLPMSSFSSAYTHHRVDSAGSSTLQGSIPSSADSAQTLFSDSLATADTPQSPVSDGHSSSTDHPMPLVECINPACLDPERSFQAMYSTCQDQGTQKRELSPGKSFAKLECILRLILSCQSLLWQLKTGLLSPDPWLRRETLGWSEAHIFDKGLGVFRNEVGADEEAMIFLFFLSLVCDRYSNNILRKTSVDELVIWREVFSGHFGLEMFTKLQSIIIPTEDTVNLPVDLFRQSDATVGIHYTSDDSLTTDSGTGLPPNPALFKDPFSPFDQTCINAKRSALISGLFEGEIRDILLESYR